MIITLVDGKISEMGSYADLLSHDGAFAEFLKNYLTEELANDDLEEEVGGIQTSTLDFTNSNRNILCNCQKKYINGSFCIVSLWDLVI